MDRNVWSYLADAGAGPDLLRAVLRSNSAIVVAPTVVFETLAVTSEEIRKRHMSLLTMANWQRLLPEAYSECMELLREIRRLRPEWLRTQPDKESLRLQRHDWIRKKGGFWEIARDNPAQLAEQLGMANGGHRSLQDATRAEAKQRRDQFREDPKPGNWRLQTITGTPNFAMPGWNGDPIHPWRFAAWSTMTVALAIPGHSYRDWLSSEVDLRHLDSRNPSWGKFWLHDVDVLALPRFWLRWAFEWLQGFQKYTPGTPADAALATYLPECDLFLSADGNIIRNAALCKSDAPCPMPEARRIPGGPDAVQTVLTLISNGW